jgi:hypothetical protein
VVPKDIATLSASIADPAGDPDAAAAILSGAAR